jgi:hypothetical protein
LKTQDRLANDENGFMIAAIILIVLAIVVIALIYFFPWYTIGALLCIGAIFLLFNGTMEPKYALILMIAGVVMILLGVFL